MAEVMGVTAAVVMAAGMMEVMAEVDMVVAVMEMVATAVATMGMMFITL